MKRTLSHSEAVSLLMGDEYAKWSYKAATALVEHIQEIEDDTGKEFEFCTVALRCDWSEYSTLHEIARDYLSTAAFKEFESMSPEDQSDYVIGMLHRKTNWIQLPENAGYLVRAF